MHKMTSISLKIAEVVILSVAQLVTTVIFFSTWDKPHFKWDNSQNWAQKMRNYFLFTSPKNMTAVTGLFSRLRASPKISYEKDRILTIKWVNGTIWKYHCWLEITQNYHALQCRPVNLHPLFLFWKHGLVCDPASSSLFE